MHRLLWSLQVLLAAVFLFAGSVKLIVPVDVLQPALPLPGAMIRFIGSVECLGALGLILPALLRIRPVLTPLAATGLVIVMAGATVLSPVFTDGDYTSAALPLVLGLLAGFVAYGRARRVRIEPRPRLGRALPLAAAR